MPKIELEPMYTEHGYYVHVNGKIVGLVWKEDLLAAINKNKADKTELQQLFQI